MKSATHKFVLVTGASGFIGRHLVRRLIERHCRVSCLVLANSRANSNMDELRSIGIQLITGDVADRDSVKRALDESQAGTVFHLAGVLKAQPGAEGRGDFMRVNAGGVETVAAACADRAVLLEPPILVVVSSVAAAGPCVRRGELRVEGDVPAPVSNYGRSKLAGEHAAAKYAGAVPITIVRPSIVFGPGDRAVLELFRPIARRGVYLVPTPMSARGAGSGRGRGIGRRDHRFSFIHVDDLVEGLLLAAEKGERLPQCAPERGSPRSGGGAEGGDGQGIYFMAGDEHPTYAQFGLLIATALGKKPPTVIHLPSSLMRLVGVIGDVIARIRNRPGWVCSDKITEALAGSWTCSSAKAHTQLGWYPAANLGDRLHETALWYREAGWL